MPRVPRLSAALAIALLALSACVAPQQAQPTATVAQAENPEPVNTELTKDAVATMLAFPEPVETQEALETMEALPPPPTEEPRPTVEYPTQTPTATPAAPEGQPGLVKWRKRYAGQPIAAGDGGVYIVTDACLCALDKETGDDKWAFPLSGGFVYTPVVTGGLVIFGLLIADSNNLYIYALESMRGQEKWKVQVDRDLVGPILAFDEGVYFVTAPVSSGSEGKTTSVGAYVHALDASNGASKWTLSVPSGYTYVAADRPRGAVYFDEGHGSNRLYSISLRTRQEHETSLSPGAFAPANVVGVRDGIVYFMYDDTFYAADSETGHAKWHWNQYRIIDHLIGEEVVYLHYQVTAGMHAVTGAITVRDTVTGQELWYSNGCASTYGLSEYGGVAYQNGCTAIVGMVGATAPQSFLQARDARTGAGKWSLGGGAEGGERPSPMWHFSNPIIAEGIAYFAGSPSVDPSWDDPSAHQHIYAIQQP